MLAIDHLVKQQRVALEAGNTTQALQILSTIEERIAKGKSWAWLKECEPESYEQLCSKLEDAAEVLTAGGQTIMNQLIRIFTWCDEHDIELSTLDVSEHIHKYREASGVLSSVISRQAAAAEITQDLLAGLETIQSHTSRAETRAWVQTQRFED